MKIHIVKKGDTLYELAKKYHSTLDQIIAINPQIADPNVLDIGMKVKIPSKPKPVDPPASEFVYKHIVQQGDSLWKLGKAWDVPLQAMIAANPQLKNPNVLMTGEVVFVPKMQHGAADTTHHTPSKASSMPFDHMPEAQPMTPSDASPPPYIPVPEETMPEAMQPMPMPMPMQPMPAVPAPAPEQTLMPEVPSGEPEDIALQEPYEQPATHPFKQFHITATEVFAYPEANQQEAAAHPAFMPYQQQPWQQAPHHAQMPTFPVSNEGCGCGGPAIMEQPWMTGPEGFATGPLGNPWEGQHHGYHHGMPSMPNMADMNTMPSMPNMADMNMMPSMPNVADMNTMPFMPNMADMNTMPFMPNMADMQTMSSMPNMPYMPDLYPQGTPFDMGQSGHNPFAFQPGPYGIPYAGAHYQAPFESPMMPQVHTHELTKESDKDEVVEIDIRTNKQAKSKNSGGSSKKAKLTGTDALNAFVRRQQRAVLESQESRPNVPWINF
ncbi:LysM peptidoglycan-binding domain-containing protein [Paenibacillus anseongense]|uniref:LysM peptidoglycan-binding domain-containing protein n=1 Tax=Paenibacillus anseongense TaxID=2682845 RepID=UPI002DBAEFA5|nr:LysM peptidoglycan-binding domain-containing protein [Paenibacillus anseongense]MEC0269820.1 LysM peptidoglycan-binding domain-containing protein [Paenibacillus anseongense]